MVRLKFGHKLQNLRFIRLKLKYIHFNLIGEIKKFFSISKKSYIVKTMSRSSTIFPIFKKVVIYIYNGKKYIPFLANDDQMGHKLGEFIFTRRFLGHKKQGKRLVVKKKSIQPTQSFQYYLKNSVQSKIYLKKKIYEKTYKSISLS